MQNTVYKNSVGLAKAKFPALSAVVWALFLAACGGGEDQPTQPSQSDTVVHIPEQSICMTTVPVPPECQKR